MKKRYYFLHFCKNTLKLALSSLLFKLKVIFFYYSHKWNMMKYEVYEKIVIISIKLFILSIHLLILYCLILKIPVLYMFKYYKFSHNGYYILNPYL